MNTDRWYYRLFQSAPDLIRELLPGSNAVDSGLGLDPAAPGDHQLCGLPDFVCDPGWPG